MYKYISKTRVIYFLSALVIIIGCYALNLSYSMFVQTEESNLVDAVVPTLNVSLDKNNVLVPPNKTEIYNFVVNNQSEASVNFIINASTLSSNYLIQIVDSEDNLSYGTLDANSKKNIVLAITNNNESEISIDFNIAYDYSTVSYDFDNYLSTTIIDNINKYNNNFKSKVISNDLVTNGDGLYNIDGNFIFKGLTVNNYLKFSSDTSKIYRIVSLNNDSTIKLVREGLIKNSAFDASSNRTYNTENSLVNSSFCTYADATPSGEETSVKYGCNVFKSYDSISNDFSSGNVVNDSTIKQYLDGEYMDALTEEVKGLIISHTFYNGFIKPTDTILTAKEKNDRLSYDSNIGMLNIKDVINSDLTITDTDTIEKVNMSNYLVDMSAYNIKFWLLNGSSDNTWDVWTIHNRKKFSNSRASRENQTTSGSSTIIYFYVKPVIFINDNVTYTGTGTSDDPYIIQEN